LQGQRGAEQGQVERAAADEGLVHPQRPAGEPGGLLALAQVPEAVRHPGGQVGLIEVGQPARS
jgi:hypothetical protein